MQEERYCPQCGEHKPVAEMTRDRHKASGYASRCKSCDTKRSLARYRAKPKCDCGKPQHAKGMCKACYCGWYRQQNPDTAEALRLAKRDAYVPVGPTTRTCLHCEREYLGTGNGRMCSEECRDQRRRELQRAREHKRSYDAAAQRIKYAQRRTRLGSLTDVTPEWEMEFRRTARVCAMCNTKLTRKWNQPNSLHVDHIYPVNIGGITTKDNLRALCRDCNLTRPKDGSDLTGQQLTLTMVDANACADVIDLDARRNEREARKAARAQKQAARALCKTLANTGLDGLGSVVLRARVTGCRWEEAAALVPWSNNAGNAYLIAARAGTPPKRANDRAVRAQELHNSGMTWREVAEVVGYANGKSAAKAVHKNHKRFSSADPVLTRRSQDPSPRCSEVAS